MPDIAQTACPGCGTAGSPSPRGRGLGERVNPNAAYPQPSP